MAEHSNLWETILRDSTKRSRLPEGTILFIGESCSGKNELVEKLTSVDSKQSNRSKTEILSYCFFHATDPDEGPVDIETATRINLWSLGDQAFGASDLVLDPTKLERAVIMIGLDLSQIDTCCDYLRKWSNKAKQCISSFDKKLGDEAKKLRIEQNATYNNNIRNQTIKITGESESTVEQSIESTSNFISSLSIPIVVVGYKSHFVQVDDLSTMKKAKEVQGQLRSLCMSVGAALVYNSVEKDINSTRLHKYLLHRLYPETFNTSLSIEDGLASVFIPAGFDSSQLIFLGTGVKTESVPPLDESMVDISKADSPTSEGLTATTTTTATNSSQLELEDEQTWLAGLHSYIEQVVAAPVAMPKSASQQNMTTPALLDSKSAKTARVPATKPATAPNTANMGTEDIQKFFEGLMKG